MDKVSKEVFDEAVGLIETLYRRGELPLLEDLSRFAEKARKSLSGGDEDGRDPFEHWRDGN